MWGWYHLTPWFKVWLSDLPQIPRQGRKELRIKIQVLFSHQDMFNSLVITWIVVCQAPLSTVFPRQETLKWVAISFSRGSSWPRDWAHISCIGRWILFFYHWVTWETLKIHSLGQMLIFSSFCFLPSLIFKKTSGLKK